MAGTRKMFKNCDLQVNAKRYNFGIKKLNFTNKIKDLNKNVWIFLKKNNVFMLLLQ